MKIFLIRHAESLKNTRQNNASFPDYLVPLTQNGKLQATECGEFMKQYCIENNIDLTKSLMLISPYERTRHTGKIINDILGVKNAREEVFLVEQNYGLFDDLTPEQRTKYPNEFELYKKFYSDEGKFYFICPMGESRLDVTVRASQVISQIFDYAKQGIENFFLISHGTFIKCFLLAFFHHNPTWFISTPNMQNCAVRLIEKVDDKTIDHEFIYKGYVNK